MDPVEATTAWLDALRNKHQAENIIVQHYGAFARSTELDRDQAERLIDAINAEEQARANYRAAVGKPDFEATRMGLQI